jgi:hypothetical protein
MVQENKLNNFHNRDKEQTIIHHRVHISTSSTNNRRNTAATKNLHKPKCQTTIFISIETISHLTSNNNMDNINNNNNLIKINLANIKSNNLNLRGNSRHSTKFKIFLTNSLNKKEISQIVLKIAVISKIKDLTTDFLLCRMIKTTNKIIVKDKTLNNSNSQEPIQIIHLTLY